MSFVTPRADQVPIRHVGGAGLAGAGRWTGQVHQPQDGGLRCCQEGSWLAGSTGHEGGSSWRCSWRRGGSSTPAAHRRALMPPIPRKACAGKKYFEVLESGPEMEEQGSPSPAPPEGCWTMDEGPRPGLLPRPEARAGFSFQQRRLHVRHAALGRGRGPSCS